MQNENKNRYGILKNFTEQEINSIISPTTDKREESQEKQNRKQKRLELFDQMQKDIQKMVENGKKTDVIKKAIFNKYKTSKLRTSNKEEVLLLQIQRFTVSAVANFMQKKELERQGLSRKEIANIEKVASNFLTPEVVNEIKNDISSPKNKDIQKTFLHKTVAKISDLTKGFSEKATMATMIIFAQKLTLAIGNDFTEDDCVKSRMAGYFDAKEFGSKHYHGAVYTDRYQFNDGTKMWMGDDIVDPERIQRFLSVISGYNGNKKISEVIDKTGIINVKDDSYCKLFSDYYQLLLEQIKNEFGSYVDFFSRNKEANYLLSNNLQKMENHWNNYCCNQKLNASNITNYLTEEAKKITEMAFVNNGTNFDNSTTNASTTTSATNNWLTGSAGIAMISGGTALGVFAAALAGAIFYDKKYGQNISGKLWNSMLGKTQNENTNIQHGSNQDVEMGHLNRAIDMEDDEQQDNHEGHSVLPERRQKNIIYKGGIIS